MKTLITFIAMGILVLTGCSSNEPKTPTTDERYIASLNETLPDMNTDDEEKLIGAANGICDVFRKNGVNERSFTAFVNGFTRSGEFSPEETGNIAFISTKFYCPKINKELIELSLKY